MTRQLCVVVDYENVLRTGHAAFAKARPLRDCTIDPFRYACQVARVLNKGKRTFDAEWVEVARVEVFRGLPNQRANPTGYSLNRQQRDTWTKGHVGVVDVTLRPLQRRHDGQGWNEKGVDVLCALAVVRAARSPLYDVVALASRDSDLSPALDEALRDHSPGTRIETVKWWDPDSECTRGSLRSTPQIEPTLLWESEYKAALDPNRYETRAQRRARLRINRGQVSDLPR